MPQTNDQPLPPIIQDLILDNQIRSLEGGLLHAERTSPDDPLLPVGWAILDAMKREQARRQNAYAEMLDADPDDVDALWAVENIRRELFRSRPEEFQGRPV
jgi:hypothetical protein